MTKLDDETEAELARIKRERLRREGRQQPATPQTAPSRGERGDDPSAAPALPWIWAEDLERQPVDPRKWVINEIIPAGAVSGFYGPGGAGKDTILMQLAAAGISARKWFGFDVNARKFLYINVDSFQPDVVIVGNRVNIFSVEQNSDAQAQQCIRLLGRLTTPNGRAVLMPAHPSRAGISSGTGEFGTVQWQNGVRAQIYLERKPTEKDGEVDDDARLLTLKKTNYGPLDKEVAIRWSNGVFVIDTGVPPSHVVGQDEQHAEQVFLMMLDRYNAHGRPVSGSAQARNNAPKVFSEDCTCPLRGKVGKRALKHAMDRLFRAGEVENRPYGPPSRPATCLARSGSAAPSHTSSHTFPHLPTPLCALSPIPPSECAHAEGVHTRWNGRDESEIDL